jgi:signal transduction histidine kinase
MNLADLCEQNRIAETKAVLGVVTSWMVLPLYFVFWLCDIIYVPEQKWEFLGLRALVVPLAIFIYLVINTAHTFKHVQVLALLYMVGLGSIINAMIYLIEDPFTPYYAGLNLIAVGGLSFIPFSVPYFVLAALGIFGPYYIIVFSMAANTIDVSRIAILSFFIFSTVVITLIVRVYREHLRRKELRMRGDLADEVERRRFAESELIQARDQALSANEAKSAFLANMSHELRTPLNAIIGYAELLQEELEEECNEGHISDLKRIDTSGKHLLAMINSILDISKIEAGRMELSNESFNLDSLLIETREIIEPLAAKNGNSLRFLYSEDIGELCADEMKLRQLLLNLLSNACKFTSEGTVCLMVNSLNIAGVDWVKFSVRDTGIGMTPEQTVKVFQPFSQADTGVAKKYGGTGLGLAISQRFCQMMGGDITVRSQVGMGTTFTVYLPRRNDDLIQKNPRVAGRDRRNSIKQVLIVQNDDEYLQSLLEIELLGAGFHPVSTKLDGNIKAVIDSLQPDILLLPARLANDSSMDMAALYEQMKASNIPVIVASSNEQGRTGNALGISKCIPQNSALEQLNGRLLVISPASYGLRGQDYRVASNLAEALDILHTESFDSIALDPSVFDANENLDAHEFFAVLNSNCKQLVLLGKDDCSPENLQHEYQIIDRALGSSHVPERQFGHQLNSLVVNFVRG